MLMAAGCAGSDDGAPEPLEGYAVTAQFYDLLAGPNWETKLGPAVARALDGFDPGDDWVLDIGAGTGLSTAAVLRSLPNARMMAIEPDPSMRAALMTRVTSDARLRKQVSIIPAGLFETEPPPRIAAAVVVSTVHHFAPAERRRFWALLAERLTPRGRAVVEIQLPENAAVPRSLFHAARVGEIDYQGWMQAHPIEPTLQRWTMGYRTLRDGRVLDDQSTTYDMHTVGFEEIGRETAAAGLSAERQDDFVILRRSST